MAKRLSFRRKERTAARTGKLVSHPSRRARRVAETRERIYQAALALFAEHGFAATTVEEITEAADVGKGTFFNYFPTKEHVLGRFGESRVATVAAALEQARRGADTLEGSLRRCVMKLTREPEKNPRLMCSILAANFSSEAVRRLTCRNLARARDLLAEVLALGQARGEVRRDYPAKMLAQIFQHLFLGVQTACSIEPGLRLSASFEKSFDVTWPALKPQCGQTVSKRRRKVALAAEPVGGAGKGVAQ